MFECVSRVFLAATIGLGAVVPVSGTAHAARTEPTAPTLQTFDPFVRYQQDAAPVESQRLQFDRRNLQIAFADDVTQAIIVQLQRGTNQCNRLQVVYRIDCLSQVYAQAAGASGNRPDYNAANSQLRKLSRQLKGIVRQNQDRKAEKVRQGNRSYRAVTREALRSANQQARKAIEEASTQLLRSAGNSKKRKVHYTRIANAVNSTKKILRS